MPFITRLLATASLIALLSACASAPPSGGGDPASPPEEPMGVAEQHTPWSAFARPPGLGPLPEGALLREVVSPARHAELTHTALIVYADGRWAHSGPGGERAGVLSGEDLATLAAAIEATRFGPAMGLDTASLCRAVPDTQIYLEASGGHDIGWQAPCSGSPDPTVEALRQLAWRLTAG